MWEQELEKRKETTTERIAYVRSEQKRFEELIKSNSQSRSDENVQLRDIIKLLFEMLSEEATYSLALIDAELEKVEKLIEMRAGPDNAI